MAAFQARRMRTTAPYLPVGFPKSGHPMSESSGGSVCRPLKRNVKLLRDHQPFSRMAERPRTL
jgi:hypothetical protein